MTTPTPVDRLALAVCESCGEDLCPVPCRTCREASTAVAHALPLPSEEAQP